jgi:CHRD domain
MDRSLFVLLSMVATLLLVGCGGTTTSNPPASTPAGSTTTATATLKHAPTGTATFSWDPSSHTLTVTLKLIGLAPGPNSIHPAYIYEGSCRNQGKRLYQLKPDVEADTHGDATTVTSPISNVMNGIPATGWSVTVYNGPGSSADDQLQIVCGDVANPNAVTTAAQSVQVPLNEAPPSSVGQSATGTAQLTLSGGTLTVKLTVNKLAPNSTHAVHIHLGSCASQGPVEHPLMTLTADASGNASGTTTIPNVSAIPKSGWYVNVHRTTDMSTSIGFDPIACGDVTPS